MSSQRGREQELRGRRAQPGCCSGLPLSSLLCAAHLASTRSCMSGSTCGEAQGRWVQAGRRERRAEGEERAPSNPPTSAQSIRRPRPHLQEGVEDAAGRGDEREGRGAGGSSRRRRGGADARRSRRQLPGLVLELGLAVPGLRAAARGLLQGRDGLHSEGFGGLFCFFGRELLLRGASRLGALEPLWEEGRLCGRGAAKSRRLRPFPGPAFCAAGDRARRRGAPQQLHVGKPCQPSAISIERACRPPAPSPPAALLLAPGGPVAL